MPVRGDRHRAYGPRSNPGDRHVGQPRESLDNPRTKLIGLARVPQTTVAAATRPGVSGRNRNINPSQRNRMSMLVSVSHQLHYRIITCACVPVREVEGIRRVLTTDNSKEERSTTTDARKSRPSWSHNAVMWAMIQQ